VPLVNAGRDFICQRIIGEAATAFDNSNAYIGVGDSSTNSTPLTYTDLQAASNKTRKVMDGSYPQRATNVLTFRSTFSTSEANYAWNEWAIFNASSAGTMLSRKVESLGTKPGSQTWQFTVTLTLTV
jgi:transglutaminase/protease-like cytokinesis protein 3